MTGTVFDIKECAVHDGPGIRTTVFFKGCPLRCAWCHNPEGLSSKRQLMLRHARCVHCGNCQKGCDHEECRSFGRCIHACPNGAIHVSGRVMTSDELCERVLRDRDFFDSCGGGVTFSGGEPLMQHDFLFECLDKLKYIHTAVETSGYAEEAVFDTLLEKCRCVIMDIKLADNDAHKKYTGVGNREILRNAARLRQSGVPHIFRTPLIPHITDTDENLSAVKALVGGSAHEFIPYNAAAGAKYGMLGMRYPYETLVKSV